MIVQTPYQPLDHQAKKYLVHSWIESQGAELKKKYLAARSTQTPPKKREPTKVELKEFYSKPEKLLTIWRAFQEREGYLNAPKHPRNLKLLRFTEELIKAYNLSPQRLEDQKQPLAIPRNYRLSKLAHKVNKLIGPEFQEEFWNSRPREEREAIINEQKHKYGTNSFRNNRMVRIVSQKTREHYMAQIQAHAEEFRQAGFSFLGLGFSGVVFLVLDSVEHESNIPKYVLKIPASGEFAKSSTPNGNPIKEKTALSQLTQFSINYETHRPDRYSQRLACYQNLEDGKLHYLVERDSANKALATIFQKGLNVYQTAHDDNCVRKKARELAQAAPPYENPHTLIGLQVPQILEMIRYYIAMAESKINFCDLYPHNMHYVPEEGSYKFIDIFTDNKEALGRSVEARKAFPVDLCVFDLITFLVLHEQKHAFTIEIRRNIKEMIGAAMRALRMDDDLDNKELIKEIYEEYLEANLSRIKQALELAVQRGIFSIKQLRAALSRLTQPENYSSAYRQNIKGKGVIHYFNAPMRISFEKLTKRGMRFLNTLREHFETLRL